MPDMRDAMRNAGLSESETQRNRAPELPRDHGQQRRPMEAGPVRGGGPRPGAPTGRNQRRGAGGHSTGAGGSSDLSTAVPADYPSYFTADGYLRPELVQGVAEAIARCFREAQLNRHQLRSFYDHAKRQEQRIRYGAPFDAVHAEIVKLKAVAADRAGRANNALPGAFKDFIDRNVAAVKDEKTFRDGFVPHFEAVVAYCANLRER